MKKSWKQALITGMAVLAMGALVAGCGSDQSSNAQPKEKVIKVGTNATFVPFEFKEQGSDQLTGFDIDMINAVAKKIGAKVDFKNVAFDALIPALGTKEIDLAASGMTITKARAQSVLFSSPYYESGMAVVVKEDANINDLKGLEGKTIAVQMGTTGADLAKKIQGAQLKQFNHSSEALLELHNGGVVAAVLDLPVAQYYVSKHPEDKVKVISFPNTKEYFGFAIAKDNKDLQAQVNKALAEMKKDGELDQIYQKWFKTKAPDMPTEWAGN